MFKSWKNFLLRRAGIHFAGEGEGGGGDGGGASAGGGAPAAGEKEGVTYAYPSDLDASYHGNPTILKHANDKGEFSQAGLMKGLIHATSALGSDKMLVPNKNWTAEQWSETNRSLGCPEKAEELALKNNLPEGVSGNDTMLSEFQNLAHSLGLRSSQGQAILDFYNQSQMNALSQHNTNSQAHTDSEAAIIKAEWGTSFDVNNNLADQAFKHVVDEKDRQAILDSGFLDSNPVKRMFLKLGQSLKEEHLTPKGQGGFNLDTAGLDAAILTKHGELMSMGKTHPQRTGTLQQYKDLMEKRWGTAPIADDAMAR